MILREQRERVLKFYLSCSYTTSLNIVFLLVVLRITHLKTKVRKSYMVRSTQRPTFHNEQQKERPSIEFLSASHAKWSNKVYRRQFNDYNRQI